MTRLLTRNCGCAITTGTGQKRPEKCECGNRFWTEAQLNPPERKSLPAKSKKRQAEEDSGARPQPRRSPIKRSEPKRDWTDARAKVEEEACCRICKRTDRKLEAAHVLGREHDEPKIGADGWPLKELYVDPDRIFPACGPSPANCHGDVDANRINYLQHLTLREQVKAVEDAGGIEATRIRLEPVGRLEEVKRDSVAA